MKKSVAVISLGKFGIQLAISLSQKGYDVVAIDTNPERVDEIKELVNFSVVLDATDEKAMRSVNVDTVDIAVVSMGTNVQSSLLTTALLQKLGVVEIYVRSINQLQESILLSMGIPVNRIINIEEEMGEQLSSSLVSGKIGRYIQISERHSLMEIRVPEFFVDKTLKSLDIRRNYKINVVGIKRLIPYVDDEGEVQHDIRMTDIPDPEDPLQVSDVLVILGTDEHIETFVKLGDES
jgi:trk system potassium uptake protein TrkA|tara:strand:- start:173 stop:880 length:708 start_codon:yes stop_codon:yes gene_type:complete